MLRSTSTLSRLADVFSRGAASRGAVAGIDYLFPGPNEREHQSLASVGRPFAQAQRSFAADAAEGEEHEMDSGDEADADGHPREHHVVEGRERSLDDYEQLIGVLARRRRAYKIRDVFDEMDINGVNPGPMTYFRSMFACMKARRLGDTLYYWERMQHSGIQPDVRSIPNNRSASNIPYSHIKGYQTKLRHMKSPQHANNGMQCQYVNVKALQYLLREPV